MSKLRQELLVGASVVLDEGYTNSSVVIVAYQTPGKLITTVHHKDRPNDTWDVMTDRLSKIK